MRTLGGLKISLLDFLLILCLVIYGGNASLFTREYGLIINLSTYVPLGLALLVGIKHKITLSRSFFICLAIFVVHWLFASVVNGYFSFGFISYWIVTFIICYICCQSYGIKYIDYFETIVFFLTIISMLFWGAYLVSPDLVTSFCEGIRWGESFSDHTEVINIGVYTILDVDYSRDEWHIFYRNSGFAWEPGAFSVFLCFAIACNIFRKGGIVLKGNIPLVLYLAALFSTESTTGGFTLMMVLATYLLAGEKGWKSLIFLIMLIPFFIWIVSLDFVGAKFGAEFESAKTIRGVGNASQYDGGTPRLISFLLYFQEFLTKPIFGLAGDPHTFLESEGFKASLHSGIGKLLADFGIIMSCLFIFSCIKTNNFIHKITKSHYAVIYAALLGSMISFKMWESPIFFVFVILGLFMKPAPTKEHATTKQTI